MKQVSGIAVAAIGAGLVFLWSGIKGSSVLTTIQEIIQGKRPAFAQTHPISTPSGESSTTPAGGPQSPSAAGPAGGGKAVCASFYGGPSDHTGNTGYHGDTLGGTSSFAELGMGTAMGGLPYRQKVRVTYKGRSVVAEKLDIGAGGPGCGGHPRAIDLWWETAQALGFSGLDVVEFEVI